MKGETLMFVLLAQLVVIIGIARLAAFVSKRLSQPIVVGEIMAGLILGPSFLGRFFHGTFTALFPEATSQYIYVLAQLGMIFLLFLIGLEFDFGKIRSHGQRAALIACCSFALPFTMGIGLGRWMHGYFPETDPTALTLFIAAAISITAIPILGRIMIEFNLHRTYMGTLTITAAAIDDILGWIGLASVAAIVASKFNALMIVQMLALTAFFAIVCLKALRPLVIRYMVPAVVRNKGQLDFGTFAVLLVGIFACAMATNKIGIFSLFGPFIMGAAIYDQEELKQAIFAKLKDFITIFFLPIFFTYTGLHTDMGSLGSGPMWLVLGVLLLVSFFGKTVGAFVAARLSGLKNREAGCVGIMINTRALMGLIAANLGREMGAITAPVYCMLVIMCALSTVVTWPILRRLIHGTELGEAFKDSEYMRSRAKFQETASPLEEQGELEPIGT